MENAKNKDYAISLIRLIATGFIVSCHMMQFRDSVFAWWFNVGVQIFLCMSGFLYGTKGRIENGPKFVLKQWGKILLDYYIVVIPAFIVYCIFARENVSLLKAKEVLLTYGYLYGGEHLWFIPYILVCYGVTPFLSYLFNRGEGKKNGWVMALTLILTAGIFESVGSYFNAAWIICFVVGFLLGHAWKFDRKAYVRGCIIVIISAVALNTFQIRQDYIPSAYIFLPEPLGSHYYRIQNYAHVALGVSLFVTLKALFSLLLRKGTPKFLRKLGDVSDNLSYDIYLVHQFFILGPFTLMELTGSLAVNILVIVIIAITLAVLVHFISGKLKKLFV